MRHTIHALLLCIASCTSPAPRGTWLVEGRAGAFPSPDGRYLLLAAGPAEPAQVVALPFDLALDAPLSSGTRLDNPAFNGDGFWIPDLNGDGAPEVLVGQQDDAGAVLTSPWRPGEARTTPTLTLPLGLHDIHDLAALGASEDGVWLALAGADLVVGRLGYDGRWTEHDRRPLPPEEQPRLLSGDIDDDGIADLALLSGRELSVFLAPAATSRPLGAPDHVLDVGFVEATGLAEVTGDGALDLVLRDRVLPGPLLEARAGWPLAGGTASHIADVDGDGHLDLIGTEHEVTVAGGGARVRAQVWVGPVTAEATPVPLVTTEALGRDPEVALFDGDGDGALDLVVGADDEPDALIGYPLAD